MNKVLTTVIRMLLFMAVLFLGASQGIAQKGPQTGPFRNPDDQMQARKTTNADRKKAAERNAARRAAAAQKDRKVLVPQGERKQ